VRAENNVHTLRHKKVLITAGPTREYWDPIRYLSNGSSGLMGLSLALEAARRGGRVTLVLGPTTEPFPRARKNLRILSVVSAVEMNKVVQAHLPGTAVFIGAAAVADYRPAERSRQKIKGKPPRVRLTLVRNPDILAEVARTGPRRPALVVGFALETKDLMKNALEKLRTKNLDWVIANRESNVGSPAATVTLLSRDGQKMAVGPLSKERIAKMIWATLVEPI
jgi:phosphopantothenoylcysteine decarboxylase / phosphopantothenate---cysteine ligase